MRDLNAARRRAAGRAVAVFACALVAVGAARAAEPRRIDTSAPIAIDAPAPFVADRRCRRRLRARRAGRSARPARRRCARRARAVRDACRRASTVQTERAGARGRCSIRCRRGRLPTASGRRRSMSSSTATASRVRRHGTAQRPPPAAAPRESGGWLIDSGERARGEPLPRRLRLRWSGPAEFTAAYRRRDQRRPAPVAARAAAAR